MRPLTYKAILLTVMSAVIASCSAADEPRDTAAQTTTTRSYVEEGRVLYLTHCGACHATDATGTSAGPSLLGSEFALDSYSDTNFLAAITEGVEPSGGEWDGMVPIERISHSDVGRITAFVRNLQGSG